ncbi:hypothetical protein [Bradyrhizobium japonicum]|uniref:hypothetical protein n=1 Tax=Bradyrhizobium japonicum TaxID=375 RepID=UPI0011DE0B1D|nr:hypothetical protein [Bradyrhizobium japonicum]MCD9104533.1 hypothetical protein [Bradyrhizobium japonicum]MCD9819859.1 hypothetical protein [Bradyrhizobium japonicum]MCD9895370.1 hypothetical protein [Bradyrhizobium japonicum]MCD9909434.1 hypothetical protein [Bradyrhizobium japonicum]MEB2675096.1 hypothetical protein [Bradyrhizobium japonicum]
MPVERQPDTAGLLADFAQRSPADELPRVCAQAALFASGGDAAGMEAIASRADCCGSSGIESARALLGVSVRRRMSKTIFSGRPPTDWILMVVLSRSVATVHSTGVGRNVFAAKSSASSTQPTKKKYRMIGMGPPL